MTTKIEKDVKIASAAQEVQRQNAETTTAKNETHTSEKKSIADLKQELAARLQELNHMKKLADNREKFLNTDKDLLNLYRELQNEEKTGAFDAQGAKIILQGMKNGYRNEDLFSVSNVGLILKFVEFMRNEISEKVKAIETELVA